MSRIRVLLCHVDDANADQMTQLAAFDLPEADITALKQETALDEPKRPRGRRAMPFSGTCS